MDCKLEDLAKFVTRREMMDVISNVIRVESYRLLGLLGFIIIGYKFALAPLLLLRKKYHNSIIIYIFDKPKICNDFKKHSLWIAIESVLCTESYTDLIDSKNKSAMFSDATIMAFYDLETFIKTEVNIILKNKPFADPADLLKKLERIMLARNLFQRDRLNKSKLPKFFINEYNKFLTRKNIQLIRSINKINPISKYYILIQFLDLIREFMTEYETSILTVSDDINGTLDKLLYVKNYVYEKGACKSII